MNIASDLLSIIDNIGFVSGAVSAVNALYRIGKKFRLDNNIKESLLKLEKMSLNKIEERLAFYFAFDVNQFLDSNPQHNFVLFFDTYEKLFINSNQYEKKSCDDWVRELIANLHNVLFVIAGRKKLTWSKYDYEWENYIDSHLIGELDEKSSYKFLKKCGLVEDKIIYRIIETSKGHPYYLDLQVDTYFEIKNNNDKIDIENFAENKQEILDRFLENIDKDEFELLKIMIIPRFYDKNIFKYLIKELNMSYDFTRFQEFSSYSFIKMDSKTKYYIHDLMRTGLENYLNKNNEKSLLKEIHELMFQYYEGKIDNYNNINYDKKKIYLAENIYHKLQTCEGQCFLKWLKKNRLEMLKYFQSQGEVFFLLDIIDQIINEIEYTSIDIKIFNVIADIIHLSGEYEKSVNISNEYLSQYNEKRILNDEELLFLQARSYHHQIFYVDIVILLDKVKSLEKKINSKKFPRVYNEFLKTIGSFEMLKGDFELSLKWINKSIKHSIKYGFDDYYLRTIRKKIDFLRVRSKYNLAQKKCDQAIKKSIENNYERYQLYLKCSLAEIYRAKKLYEKNLKILENAENTVKKLGIKGWEAHIYLAYANTYSQIKKFDKASNYISKAEQIYNDLNHRWGKINSSILKILSGNSKFNDIDKLLIKTRNYNYDYEYKILQDFKDNNFYNYDLLFI